MYRSQKILQVKGNKIPITHLAIPNKKMNMEDEVEDDPEDSPNRRMEDEPDTPPATPYGTPHASSHLYRANIDNICDKLGQLGELK